MPFGFGFEDVSENDLIAIDTDLNLVEGEGMSNPAQRFQMWVYDKRPDDFNSTRRQARYPARKSWLSRDGFFD